ncbi:MAG TPA: ABC transporter ATP-binding protein [Phycisphaerae bacterium]|nr:ABC transporter ATP-binding protein [Phycisphaerae bacterium]
MCESAIQIESLSYRYPDGTSALRGVDLRAEPGAKVGLVGPNGAGKSTLLLCLDGFLAARGRASVSGLSVSKANVKAIRSHVGLVFQNPDDQLFMPRLFDDVAFGPINQQLDPTQVRQRVAEALTDVGLTGMDDRAPHHLSMGQKRNAAIATVLAMKPDLLLLDEPSANLDPRSRRHLIELLAGMSITMLIASHDLDMIVQLCDRVALLDAGRIVADGATADILSDASLMDRHGLEVPAVLAPRA